MTGNGRIDGIRVRVTPRRSWRLQLVRLSGEWHALVKGRSQAPVEAKARTAQAALERALGAWADRPEVTAAAPRSAGALAFELPDEDGAWLCLRHRGMDATWSCEFGSVARRRTVTGHRCPEDAIAAASRAWPAAIAPLRLGAGPPPPPSRPAAGGP